MGLKAKLAMAVATSATGAAMIAGGTFAYFSGTASNAGNTFTAGTVVIKDYTGKGAFTTTQFYNNLAPGDAEDSTITVKNEGTLDEWVAIKDVTTDKPNSGNTNPDGTYNLFAGDHPLTLSWTEDSGHPVLVKAGQSATLHVHYYFPWEAGNEYQGAKGSATFDIEAVQARNNTNPDGSFTGNWG